MRPQDGRKKKKSKCTAQPARRRGGSGRPARAPLAFTFCALKCYVCSGVLGVKTRLCVAVRSSGAQKYSALILIKIIHRIFTSYNNRATSVARSGLLVASYPFANHEVRTRRHFSLCTYIRTRCLVRIPDAVHLGARAVYSNTTLKFDSPIRLPLGGGH